MKRFFLSEADIRQRVTTEIWTRGLDYFEQSAVSRVVWREGRVIARVRGAQYEPYTVEITFDDGEIAEAYCTCPYDWGGDCKHIIAVLLHLARGEPVEERPSLESLLAELDADAMRHLLKSLVARHPELIDEFERLAHQRLTTEEQAASSKTEPDRELEAYCHVLLRQIVGDIQTEADRAFRGGYNSWYDEDIDLSAALAPGLQQVNELLQANRPRDALTVLETMLAAWEEGVSQLDDYIIDEYIEFADEFTIELGQAWAKALLMAALSAEEREEWAAFFEEAEGEVFGGQSLQIAWTAVKQGWDYPPLVAAMQGHITEQGAWEGEAPFYADELTRIRLDILHQQGRYEAYINLALAEGQTLSYLQMLVQVGKSEKAFQEAMTLLTHPDEVRSLAQVMAEQGEVEKAVQLARYGLSISESDHATNREPRESHRLLIQDYLVVTEMQGRLELAIWLRDLAWEHDDRDTALWAAWQALKWGATLTNYQRLQEIAGHEWIDLKPKALEIVAQSDELVGKVDIYLEEGMHDEAIRVVDGRTWFFNIEKVIDAVKETHPIWAFRQCAKQAEAIMNAGKAKDYNVAAEWLRRGRDILLAAGEQAMWSEYIEEIMAVHHRKYKLMPLLRELA